MSYVSIVPTTHDIAASKTRAPAGDDLIAFLTAANDDDAAGAIEARASTADMFALENLTVSFDRGEKIVWWSMKPQSRPSFTAGLLADMNRVADSLESAFATLPGEAEPGIEHLVLSSQMPGIFNLGGDLRLFLDRIERRDREALTRYAHRCAEGQHRIVSNFGLPISTIALVQGDALGGGFEAALANDVIIAERSAKFGLPEVLFNLFPGMGAYSFLSRKVGRRTTEELLTSGAIYTARQLYDLGIVDVITPTGTGEAAVESFVRKHARSANGRRGIEAIGKEMNPLKHEELVRIVELWADAAIKLSDRDLKMMDRLVRAQQKQSGDDPAPVPASNVVPLAVGAGD